MKLLLLLTICFFSSFASASLESQINLISGEWSSPYANQVRVFKKQTKDSIRANLDSGITIYTYRPEFDAFCSTWTCFQISLETSDSMLSFRLEKENDRSVRYSQRRMIIDEDSYREWTRVK